MSAAEKSPKERLAELVLAIAREEWQNETSVSYKNRASIPGDLRDGFVVYADMGGLIVLDARGSIRVFLHDTGKQLETGEQDVRIALKRLTAFHPDLPLLVCQVGGYGASTGG